MKGPFGWMAAALILAAAFPQSAVECAALCDCLTPPDPRSALDSADAVLHVRVQHVEDHLLLPSDTPAKPARDPNFTAWLDRYDGQRHVYVRVLRVWKGEILPDTTLFTSLGNGDCGYPFESGREYLVYAHRYPSGRLVTNICRRTRPIELAAEDLTALGAATLPKSPKRGESARRPHN